MVAVPHGNPLARLWVDASDAAVGVLSAGGALSAEIENRKQSDLERAGPGHLLPHPLTHMASTGSRLSGPARIALLGTYTAVSAPEGGTVAILVCEAHGCRCRCRCDSSDDRAGIPPTRAPSDAESLSAVSVAPLA